MKTKLHLTTMMFLLMALVMAAQPETVKIKYIHTTTPKKILAANSNNLITVTCIKDCDEAIFSSPEWGYNFLDQEGHLYQYYGREQNNVITIPRGKYDVLAFYMYVPREFRHHCLVIHEQVEINNDTIVSINPNEANNRVQFIPYLPNGEKCNPGIVHINDDYSQEIVEEGNIGTLDFTLSIALRNGSHIFGMGSQWDIIRQGKQEYDLTHWSDVFINNVSDRFQFCCNMAFSNKEFNGSFYVVDFETSACEDTIISNTTENYILYEEKFKQTPYGKEQGNGLRAAMVIERLDDYTYLEGCSPTAFTYLQNDEPCRYYLCESHENTNSPLHYFLYPRVADAPNPWYPDDLYEGLWTTNNPIYLNNGQLFHVNKGQLSYRAFPNLDNNSLLDIPTLEWHPVFSYNVEKMKTISGNSSPILIPLISGYNGDNGEINKNLNYGYYIGRNGEERNSDTYSTHAEIYLNGELISNNSDYPIYSWTKTPQSTGEVDMFITNNNVDVDGISGKNVTNIHFTMTGDDNTAPTLQMLDFRDDNDNNIDRFASPFNGKLQFCCGDFNEQYIDDLYHSQYYACNPLSMVDVYYSPYQEDNWVPIEVTEYPELFFPGMGFFYSGSLASVSVPSENKWYDLKFRLVDESGNWQEQVVSPAFKIESLTPDAITEVINGDATEVARYSVDGRHITSPEQGINIVVMSDGTTRKVLVK